MGLDEDALVGSGVPFLVLGGGDLVLGFVLPGDPDPFLCAGAAEDVDLEFLGPGSLAEFRREAEAALGNVVVPVLPTMAFSATLDAGAHVLVLAVVEVIAQISVACRRRPD